MLKAKTLMIAKRSLDTIIHAGGYIHKIESMGLKDLPHRMQYDSKGSYFVVKFVAPTKAMQDVKESLRLDQGLSKSHLFKVKKPEAVSCTLQDELIPPVFRPTVQQMIKEADERVPVDPKRQFHQNTGLDYYPF